MLTVNNINQYYGGSHILRDVSFQARAGTVCVLLGRNGVGKTTLLKSLMGLLPIKTGGIELNGRPIHQATPSQRARAGTAASAATEAAVPSTARREWCIVVSSFGCPAPRNRPVPRLGSDAE